MKALVWALVLWCLFMLVVPIILIWSLNTLFPVLAIPYTFQTWVAIVLVVLIFSSGPDFKIKLKVR